MPMKRGVAIVVAGAILFGAPAYSQTEHGHGGHHRGVGEAVTPSAPGQDTFAAIAEIVAILEADPATDWSRVNISALHRHLLDMDALFTRANVSENHIPLGLEMSITMTGAGGQAAGRMVPAHAPFLAGQTGWTSDAEIGNDAVVWTVTGTGEADAARIRALGFYGLMATGAHHQRHHLAIARGETMH